MIRKIFLQLLIKWYVNKYQEIEKIPVELQIKRYLFKEPEDVLSVLKNNITVQTLRHFEATTEQERWMIKGASLALQLIKDKHLAAIDLLEIKNQKQKIDKWNKLFKY